MNELRGREGRAIPTSDGGLLVYTGDGILFGSAGEWRFHNYVFKLNSDWEEEWDVYVKDSLQAVPNNNQLTSAVELEDGSGYVVAGNLIVGVPDSAYFSGVLAKISPQGELLWKRYYQHLVSQKTRHYINDLAVAPDGGFIMVGEVCDTVNAPRQQGWLLKVDEHGCLVPDCHLLDGVSDLPSVSAAPEVLLYPNPAREQITLHIKGQRGGYRFRVVDLAGRVWQAFELPLSEGTVVLGLEGWPPGGYVVQCAQDNDWVGAWQFVK